MPNRTFHNLWNALVLGFSGNDLHAYMDRAAKSLRQKHRQVGHDIKGLIDMLILFQPKYTFPQIIATYTLHLALDGMYSGIQEGVRKKVKGYGKKEAAQEAIKRLMKEVFRY